MWFATRRREGTASMLGSNFAHSWREAWHHFARSAGTVFGAVITIFLSLFIIGVFMLGSAMIDNLVGTVEDQVTIQAFLSDDAPEAQVNQLETSIRAWANVESVTYKSKDQALEEYRTNMSNRNADDAVAALDGVNPLPASLVIKLTDPSEVETTAQKLISDTTFKLVCDDPDSPSDSVQYGRDTVARLFQVTTYIRIATIVLVVLLTFVAFVFINNTIRLAITARRREIAIMRLVGASNSFIRGPFVMEGALEAIIGAILAIVVLHFGLSALLPRLSESMQFLSFDVSFELELGTYAILLGIGFLIGILGSAIAMRRYLKV